MNRVWEREIRRQKALRPAPPIFVQRPLTRGERVELRGQAYAALLNTPDRERVVDLLLTSNAYLAWNQADELVRQVERALAQIDHKDREWGQRKAREISLVTASVEDGAER